MRIFRFEQIRARSFRNIESLDWSPHPRFNILFGDNGAGKSSLLEAIEYLSCLKSFRGAKPEEMIQEGESASLLLGKVTSVSLPSERKVVLRSDAPRQLVLDQKPLRKTAPWVQSAHTVIFHPSNMQISYGSPEVRREYLNRILEQTDGTYSSSLSAYNKAVRSRNRLLKERAPTKSIQIYDDLISATGAVISKARENMIEDLRIIVKKAFLEIGDFNDPFEMHYVTKVPCDVESIRCGLEERLQKDRERGFTTVGPHTDDVELTLRGLPTKKYASQGQNRAVALAFKIAEHEILTQYTGWVPAFLLDDVSSELDRTRNKNLFEFLTDRGGQVFLTTTHPDYILLESDCERYFVDRGNVTSRSNRADV